MRANFQTRYCPVYPGSYTPLPEKEEMLTRLKFYGKDSSALLVNMDEYQDCFAIEVAMPGIKREDIFIDVNGNILSISVLHNEEAWSQGQLKNHEFDHDFLQRHIQLPENADAAFVSAAYNYGMLTMYIPKTQKPTMPSKNHIVVY